MESEGVGEVKSALAAFPGLADIAVVEHGADLAGLPVPDLTGLLPYRAPATPRQETLCELFAEVLGVARCGVRISMADLFKAPTAGDIDRRLDLMADARK